MGRDNATLTGGEWEVYECLWETSPMTLTQIARRLQERLGWSVFTGETVVRRMDKKGLPGVEPGPRGKLYSPLFGRQDTAMVRPARF